MNIATVLYRKVSVVQAYSSPIPKVQVQRLQIPKVRTVKVSRGLCDSFKMVVHCAAYDLDEKVEICNLYTLEHKFSRLEASSPVCNARC